MRKIKIALYKNSKTSFGKVIRFQQRFLQGFLKEDYQYSHAEIVFCNLREDENFLWGVHATKGTNIFFSSSEVDGGVRFKKILPKKDNWDFVELEVTDKQYSDMLKMALNYAGCKYSTWGIILTQGMNINRSDSNKYFCSQIVSMLLHEAFGSKFSKDFYSKYNHFINPAKLSQRLRSFTNKL